MRPPSKHYPPFEGVVEEGRLANKSISICGEIASDPKFIVLLLGLGVTEFSVSSPSIPLIKD